MITDCDWAYLAGLFDGEGCLKVSWARSLEKKKRSVTWSLTLDICNTYYPVIEWVQSVFGGSIYSQERRGKESGHRRRFHWSIWDSSRVSNLLSGMLPYLKIKKHQSEIAIKFLATKRPKVGRKPAKLTEEEIATREKLSIELKMSRWSEWPAMPRRSGFMATCECGKEFERKTGNHTHCTHKCTAKYHARKLREEKRLAPVTIECPCGKRFSKRFMSSKKYCSSRCKSRYNARNLRFRRGLGINPTAWRSR